jgi:hypothetical protein
MLSSEKDSASYISDGNSTHYFSQLEKRSQKILLSTFPFINVMVNKSHEVIIS